MCRECERKRLELQLQETACQVKANLRELKDLAREQAAQLKRLDEARAADEALRDQIFSSQSAAVTQAIADMVSGQLGGTVGRGHKPDDEDDGAAAAPVPTPR